MSKIKENIMIQTHTGAIMMGVAVCILSFNFLASVVHAEEQTVTDENIGDITSTSGVSPESDLEKKDKDSDRRAAMKAQIESLRDIIEKRKAALNLMTHRRDEMKTEFKEMKAEFKEQRQLDKVAFLASLEGKSEEEKKAAMLDFITQIKEYIAAQKADMAAKRDEMKAEHDAMKDKFKADREAIKEEFKNDQEKGSRADIYASLMKRIAELRAKLEARKNGEVESQDSDSTQASDDSDEDSDSTQASDDSEEDSTETNEEGV